MPFPPETPQDYCDYFQGMALHAKPPNPKWSIGFEAAQIWRDYLEKDDGTSEYSQLLIPLVKTLMPVSSSGSILLDLWQQILRHVAKLPVSKQKGVWLEVFNVANQGENNIKHTAEAREILEEWVKLDNIADTIKINENTMIDMVNKMYMYALSGWEWLAFTLSMSEWFKKYVDEPSLYDLVWSKFEKR